MTDLRPSITGHEDSPKGARHEPAPLDAYPERPFEGTVSQVRLASTTVQNVVTYTVLVDASNPRGLLLPGMTANVTFEISRSAADAWTYGLTALALVVVAVLASYLPARRATRFDPALTLRAE